MSTHGTFIGIVDAEWHADGRTMTLNEPVVFVDARHNRWIAEAGRTIDGASIPRFFWRFIGGPFSGKYRRASVVHDVYCENRAPGSSNIVHAMFYNAMRADGVGRVKAWLMWAAVRLFGPRF